SCALAPMGTNSAMTSRNNVTIRVRFRLIKSSSPIPGQAKSPLSRAGRKPEATVRLSPDSDGVLHPLSREGSQTRFEQVTWLRPTYSAVTVARQRRTLTGFPWFDVRRVAFSTCVAGTPGRSTIIAHAPCPCTGPCDDHAILPCGRTGAGKAPVPHLLRLGLI